MKNPFNYIIAFLLISLGVVWYAGQSRVGGGLDNLIMTDQEKIDALPKELKLKAEPDDILDSEIIRDIKCDKTNINNCVDLGEIKEYTYNTRIEVPASSTIIKDGKEDVVINEDITKRTLNSLHFKVKETATSSVYQAITYPGNMFYKEGNTYYKTAFGTTTIEAFELQTKPSIISRLIGTALATDFNAGTGINGVQTSNTTWATAHDASSGTVRNDFYFQCTKSGSTYYIIRNFMWYNTSSIGAGATVTAADYHYTMTSAAGNGDGVYLVISTSTPASSTAIDAGDFDQVGITDGGKMLLPSVGGEGAKTLTLNATGISWINVTGSTVLGLRIDKDINNVAPTALNQGAADAALSANYLSITYTAGGGTTAVPNNDIIIFE